MNTSSIDLKVSRGLLGPRPFERQTFVKELASACDDIKERMGLGDKARAALDLAGATAVGLLKDAWNDRENFRRVGKDITVWMWFDETWGEWKVGVTSHRRDYPTFWVERATSGFDAAVQAELDAVLDKYGFEEAGPDTTKYDVIYRGRKAVIMGAMLESLNGELKELGFPAVYDMKPAK